jgi:hypothetical protein
MERAGHMMNLEEPGEFTSRVLQFIGSRHV